MVTEVIEEMELPPGYQAAEATSSLMAEVFDELYLVLILSLIHI